MFFRAGWELEVEVLAQNSFIPTILILIEIFCDEQFFHLPGSQNYAIYRRTFGEALKNGKKLFRIVLHNEKIPGIVDGVWTSHTLYV